MKILLTGASGFVGRCCISNWDVDILPVYRDTHNHIVNSQSILVKSIDENTKWNLVDLGIDVVVHLAGLAHGGYSSEKYKSVNTEGTLNLAISAANAGIKRFIFVSSIGVNGSNTYEKPFSFKSIPKPLNSYSLSKYNAEIGLKLISEQTGMEIVIVRPPLIYGANAPGNFDLLVNYINKIPVLPFGLLNNNRSFIFVNNLVDLLLTCARHPNAPGKTFLASDYDMVSTKKFTSLVAMGLNKKLIHIPIPIFILRLIAKSIGQTALSEQLLGNLHVDYMNIYNQLGWIPPFTMKQAMLSLLKN